MNTTEDQEQRPACILLKIYLEGLRGRIRITNKFNPLPDAEGASLTPGAAEYEALGSLLTQAGLEHVSGVHGAWQSTYRFWHTPTSTVTVRRVMSKIMQGVRPKPYLLRVAHPDRIEQSAEYMLLEKIADEDIAREGVPPTEYTCTREGMRISGVQDRLEKLAADGLIKLGHHYVDITDLGLTVLMPPMEG